jgi:hypothetical protein
MFKALFLIALAAFFFILGGFGENVPDKPFTIIYNSTAAEEKSPDFDPAKFKTPFNLLRQACPKLFLQSGDDVKSATAHSSPAMPYMTEQKGWDKMIEVKIVLKDRLNTISKSFNANGHTLYYYIGRGGVFTDKRLAQQLCGWPVSGNGASMFKVIEGISI